MIGFFFRDLTVPWYPAELSSLFTYLEKPCISSVPWSTPANGIPTIDEEMSMSALKSECDSTTRLLTYYICFVVEQMI